MEPDAQNVRFETPVRAADPEPGTQRGEVSAALRVQILSTEHWSLLATRSLAGTRLQSCRDVPCDTLGRHRRPGHRGAGDRFDDGFLLTALVILPVVLFVGIATVCAWAHPTITTRCASSA